MLRFVLLLAKEQDKKWSRYIRKFISNSYPSTSGSLRDHQLRTINGREKLNPPTEVQLELDYLQERRRVLRGQSPRVGLRNWQSPVAIVVSISFWLI